MSTSPTASNVSAYYDLVRLYAAELVTTTNWMAHRKGNLTRVIARELALQRQVSIVTFNHDLLVENALDQLPRRLHQRFCLHHSYGLLADHSWCHEAADEEFDVIRCGGDSDISIYKMHGSVNWVYRTREKNPPANLTKTKRSLFIQINKTIRPWSTTLTAAEGRGRGVWYSWPLIVPPIYEKHGLIHGELRTVWDGAANALLSATRAIFFGYSFPRADLHARYFFQGMAQRNQALRRPILLNPDPGSHGSLWEVLRPEQVTHYRSVREFLAT